jgi:hypothetical protein
MKKELTFKFIQFVFRKMSFRITVFTVLTLLSVQSSFAQTWSILGNEGQISAVASSHVSITVVDEVPYAVYVEGATSGIGKVKKINAGLWEQVGGDLSVTNISYTRIYSDKTGKLYVAYIDNGNGSKLAVKTFNGTNWEPLILGDEYVSSLAVTLSTSGTNPAGATNVRSAMAFDGNNVPYITYSVNGIPYAMSFDGSAWVGVGSTLGTPGLVSADITAVGNGIALDSNNVPYVVYINASTTTTGAIKTFRYNGSGWDSVSPPSLVATVATTVSRHVSIVIDSEDKPIVSYYNKSATVNSPIIRCTVDAIVTPPTATWDLLKITSTGSSDFKSNNLIKDAVGNLYSTFMFRGSNFSRIQVFKRDVGTDVFYELINPPATVGVDTFTGNTTTITNPPEIAVGSNTTKPYIVYLKTSALAGTPTTPVVRFFDLLQAPLDLSTKAVSNITTTSAETGGDITSDGGLAITERGIVYSTSKNPTTANTKIIDAETGTGTFTTTLSGLNPTTLYYIRAYAINSAGTVYGNILRLNTLALSDAVVTSPKQIEFLTRGVMAVRKSSSDVFISWRLLGNDPSGIVFNIYRDNIKLNSSPITTSTNFLDNISTNGTYIVKEVVNGIEGTASTPVSVWANNQLSIPLQIPPGGTVPVRGDYTYTANDCSVGDVDGDGEYEIFLKWEPTLKNDNAGGYSGKQIFDCYKLDGTRLWRIDLGINMNAGPHYNQFMVYDFDGDGKAEIILKTADGTVDGTGVVIGNPTVDYRNTSGWVQQGPEFLTVFNGLTGAAMASVPFQPARANTIDWGDNYGNRQDRFVSAVAYLDGARPSIIVGRGYYDKLVRAAYDWRDGKLTLRWIFDSKDTNDSENNTFSSQGNHQMTIGDVDGDGKDEVINGASVINDDGKRLWTYGYGHGDALHMSDMDPDRLGQEIWQCYEDPGSYDSLGIRLVDAKNGKTIFGTKTTGDVGRALAADIDPYHRGYEMWSSSGNLYNVQDGQIGTVKPIGSQAVNHVVWWDGDLGRELLDGTILDKWNPTTQSLNRVFTIYNAAPVTGNNDTKKNPCLTADLFGDWREEIILRRSDNTALIIFSTTIPANYRITTLMHDPQYRTAIAWQNSGYNQPPHPSFYIGYDMTVNPTTGNVVTPSPNIYVAKTGGLGLSPNGQLSSSAVKVYPNPTSGLFSLEFNSSESGKATVAIVALNGQTVKQSEVLLTGQSQSVLFDISAEAAGVYLIKVATKEGVTTQKIILQK